ncbi:MAG: FKBP-type peptidyl-prolyl cis-trans isomerase [Saprospiraceae bacterium]
MDSISYSLGILMAQSIKNQGFEGLNTQELALGIDDVLKNKDLKIDVEAANTMVQQFIQNQKMSQYETKIAEEKAFFEENAQRSEVQTLPSGLQYEEIIEGNGPIPTLNDKVTVHYHGTLLDGTVFDSSVDRGTPATFGVGQVIAGWVEALQLMPTGAKWKLYIPYNLAYGERGAGPTIQPYSSLIFEVELIEIAE